MKGLVLAVMAAVVAGCGSPTLAPITSTTAGPTSPTVATSATSTGPTTSTPSTSATPTATTTAADEPTGTTPVSIPDNGLPQSTLVSVRRAAQPNFDRVVFEFADALPAYFVHYVTEPQLDTSGRPAVIDGDAILVVRFSPTAVPGYAGAHRIAGDTTAVRDLVLVDDFEAVMRWGIGVDRARPFVVRALAGPPRLVIDIGTRRS